MDQPQINMEYIQDIANYYGIDLNAPLTKETAELLNYAFLNNSSLPNNTLVCFDWNEKNNTCDVSVRFTTGITMYKGAGDGDVLPGEGLANTHNYDSWGVQYNKDGIANHDMHKVLEKANAPLSENTVVFTISNNNSTVNGDTTIVEKDYGMMETHTFTVGGNDTTLKSAFESLDNQMTEEKWEYLTLQEKLDSSVYSGNAYAVNFETAYQNANNDNPKLSDYYNLDSEHIDEYTGIGEEKSTEDSRHLVYDLNGIKSYDNGFMTPEKYNDVRNLNIKNEVKDQLIELFGNIPMDIKVDSQNKTCSLSFFDAEKGTTDSILIDIQGTTEDEIAYDIVTQTSETILSDDNEGYAALKTQCYINKELNKDKTLYSDGDNFVVEPLSDGNRELHFDKYSVIVSEEELAHPESSETIQSIIDARKLERVLDNTTSSADVEIKQVNNKTLYACYANGDVKYYEKSGNNYALVDDKGNKLSENMFSAQEIADNYSSENYYSYNSRVAKNAQKAIVDADEIKYRDLIKAITKERLEEIVRPLTAPINTLDEYKKTSIDTAKLKKTVCEMDEDIELLAKLINYVVTLYTACDEDKKKVLEGILTGADDSFVDRIFNLRNGVVNSNGERVRITKEEFKERFIEVYDKYVDDMTWQVHEIRCAMQLGVKLELTNNDDLYKLQTILERRIKDGKVKDKDGKTITSSDGIITRMDFDSYYIPADIYASLFEEELNLLENCSPEEYSSVLNSVSDFKFYGSSCTALFENAISDYSSCIAALTENSNVLKSYDALSNFKPYVGYIFDEGFKETLNEVRTTGGTSGSGDITLDNSFMSAAELAMYSYLKTSVDDKTANEYKGSIKNQLNEREGRYRAANYTLELADGGIGVDDLLKELGCGIGDGLRSYPTAIRHLLADPHNDANEWTRDYTSKYLNENYDLEQVVFDYQSGKISEAEYNAFCRLTGSSLVKNSYRLTEADKQRLGMNYDLGYTMGETIDELAIDAALAVCSGFSGILGSKAFASAVKNGLKGAKKVGETLNKYADTDAWILNSWGVSTYSWTVGAATFATGTLKDLVGNALKGKSTSEWFGKSSSGKTSDITNEAEDILTGDTKEPIWSIQKFKARIGDYDITKNFKNSILQVSRIPVAGNFLGLMGNLADATYKSGGLASAPSLINGQEIYLPANALYSFGTSILNFALIGLQKGAVDLVDSATYSAVMNDGGFTGLFNGETIDAGAKDKDFSVEKALQKLQGTVTGTWVTNSSFASAKNILKGSKEKTEWEEKYDQQISAVQNDSSLSEAEKDQKTSLLEREKNDTNPDLFDKCSIMSQFFNEAVGKDIIKVFGV